MKFDLDDLVLYHYQSCPYCARVREVVDRLDLDLEYRDIRRKKKYRKELKKGGGKPQVPCLRIEPEEGPRWLYESDDIIDFLVEFFGQAAE